MSHRLLIIEDDADINKLVTMNLRSQQYLVESVARGDDGLEKALTGNYDLIVLDISLPGIDGLSVCQELRKRNINTPLLMLTARDAEVDRVLGLEMGADDYLTKPFSVRELQARVKALLRRAVLTQHQVQEAQNDHLLKIGELEIHRDRREVLKNGTLIDLTGTEFDLLVFMAQNPGKVFNRSELLDHVWGYQHSGYEHTVNSHINRLRTKIEKDTAKPNYVITVWGTGYKFNDNVGL